MPITSRATRGGPPSVTARSKASTIVRKASATVSGATGGSVKASSMVSELSKVHAKKAITFDGKLLGTMAPACSMCKPAQSEARERRPRFDKK